MNIAAITNKQTRMVRYAAIERSIFKPYHKLCSLRDEGTSLAYCEVDIRKKILAISKKITQLNK
jgi:hypothetical protein